MVKRIEIYKEEIDSLLKGNSISFLEEDAVGTHPEIILFLTE
jgi:hypothetical protein